MRDKLLIPLVIVLILSFSVVSGGLLVRNGDESSFFGLNVKNLCIDTDKNKDEPSYKRGYVQDLNGIYWDECNLDMNAPDLVERSCDEGFVVSEYIECERGCYLGACIKYSPFSLPRRGTIPASRNDLQRPTEQSTHKESSPEYKLTLFNLGNLNDLLKDIDSRLASLEKQVTSLSESQEEEILDVLEEATVPELS